MARRVRRHFSRVAERLERMGAPVFLARTQVAWAQSLLGAGGAAAEAEARTLLDATAATARERGCADLERQAAELADKAQPAQA
jgi:hypothetical protein